ncbi:MAG TPA: protein-L-isoaspartate O-methyltransferase, partial [Casimicrobiaceae bacterium]|nr:protein-L-isoaspartate O-methyltransferase [Casimicrobiaceae bacterium]
STRQRPPINIAPAWDNRRMDIEKARFNMVEQQIRTWDVLDQDVLDLLFVVKREDFVPAAYRMLAFADLEIPLGAGQKMWTPKLEARVLQELRLRRGEHVLEIGTGSGYFTALLCARGAQVTSVEIDPRLAEQARAKLARFDIGPVELAIGDGARGWGKDTYDAIVLTGSTPVLADAFLAQLKPGGRVFAVTGEPPVMKARMTHWVAEGSYAVEDLFETVIDPLRNAPAPSRFEF